MLDHSLAALTLSWYALTTASVVSARDLVLLYIDNCICSFCSGMSEWLETAATEGGGGGGREEEGGGASLQ